MWNIRPGICLNWKICVADWEFICTVWLHIDRTTCIIFPTHILRVLCSSSHCLNYAYCIPNSHCLNCVYYIPNSHCLKYVFVFPTHIAWNTCIVFPTHIAWTTCIVFPTHVTAVETLYCPRWACLQLRHVTAISRYPLPTTLRRAV
jgi:hypothetical protein